MEHAIWAGFMPSNQFDMEASPKSFFAANVVTLPARAAQEDRHSPRTTAARRFIVRAEVACCVAKLARRVLP